MKITKENISNLLGKTIRWSAPAAEGNFPYGGLARITAVKAEERNPLTTDELAGCTLDLAFFPDGSDTLCYSVQAEKSTPAFSMECLAMKKASKNRASI